VAKLLANKTYVGLIDWNGVLVQGQHQPLVSPELFQQVQDLLAARSARGTRERKHHHYLKGVMHCAVCTRRYFYLVATGKSGRRYPYFYCLGTRPAGRGGGCREPHLPADRLERQVEQLYERIQLPHPWLTELQSALEAEINARQGQAAHEHQQLDRELMGLDGERRKLLEAYYADAIDPPCSAKNRAESASGPGPKPAAAPSQQTWANGGPSWRPLGGSPPTVAPPTVTPTHRPASCSTAPSSTASRSATATSPTLTTGRPSTCSLAGRGLNTELWWS
jgi:hypothetical protein